MVNKGHTWAFLDVIGMALLSAGALGVIEIISLGQLTSEILMAVGIVLIVISSTFIQVEGTRLRKEQEEFEKSEVQRSYELEALRKEQEEFERFEEIRNDARWVPNDLDEPYLIDYTAEPSRAISYKNNVPKKETRLLEHDENSKNGILIIHSN